MMRALMKMLTVAALAVSASTGALAADAAACKTVRMSDPGWTDITSTNALLGIVMGALGYQQTIDTLAVPVTFEALKSRQIDLFLGNWMPAQAGFVEPLVASGDLVVINQNLSGIRFTLAVPRYVADAGVASFSDLQRFAEKFDRKIYGIESGAAVNQNLLRMLAAEDYGLAGWELVESSEQAMLGQVARAQRRKEWIVFVAWEPHPMNTKFEPVYLSGGEKYVGPNLGSSSVHSISRKGFATDCPNLARLVTQTRFTVPAENAVMGAILDDGKAPEAAALGYLKANPATIEPWLAGVTTFDGRDGANAVKAKLER